MERGIACDTSTSDRSRCRSCGGAATPLGSLRTRNPTSFHAPTTLWGTDRAVDGLMRIWEAVAVASIDTVSLAPGPEMMNSRCELPTRKNWKRPLWMPIDILRRTSPAEVWMPPIWWSSRRIPVAARTARTGCASPEKNRSRASPPNFSRPPPSAYASDSSRLNTASRTSVTSSAPTLPWRAKRSDIFVNPEMSTRTRDPSSSWAAGRPGSSMSHCNKSRGR